MGFALLSLFLTLTPAPTLAPLYEEIKLTDSLVLRAEYLPIGAVTQREGMFFTVEDFIVMQTEIEFSGDVCVLRLNHLKESHLAFVSELQKRCEEEYSSIEFDLEKAVAANAVLTKDLKNARKWGAIFKWSAIGLTTALIGTSTYILLNR